jgi:hypothetical protein
MNQVVAQTVGVHLLKDPVKFCKSIQLVDCVIPNLWPNMVSQSFAYTALDAQELSINLETDDMASLGLTVGPVYLFTGLTDWSALDFDLDEVRLTRSAPFSMTFESNQKLLINGIHVPIRTFLNTYQIPDGYYGPLQLGTQMKNLSNDPGLQIKFVAFEHRLGFSHTAQGFFKIQLSPGLMGETPFVSRQLIDPPMFIYIGVGDSIHPRHHQFLVGLTVPFGSNQTLTLSDSSRNFLLLDPPRDIHKLVITCQLGEQSLPEHTPHSMCFQLNC